MGKARQIQTSKFVRPVTSTEGCEWTVYVNLAAAAPVASVCRVEEVPMGRGVTRLVRGSCEKVARSVAARMNAARHTD
jgi:hypothetical protein